MTDYKAPFNTIGPFHPVYDAIGWKVNAQYIVDALNAHARLSAQRCETCRYWTEMMNGCGLGTCARHANSVWSPSEGCTAYAPKEGK